MYFRRAQFGVLAGIAISLATPACAGSPNHADAPASSRAIPKEIGVVHLTGTRNMPRGDAGVMYSYRDGRFRPDVFVYPRSGAPDVRMQAYDFIETLKFMRVWGRTDAFRVLLDEPVAVEAHGQTLPAHEIIAQVLRRGTWSTTYFVVVALPEQYIKFRITHSLGNEAAVRSRDFVRDWLNAYLSNESQ